MRFEKCSKPEIPELIDFYRNVSNNTDTMVAFGRWNYGKYPTDSIITTYVENAQMYCLRDKNGIYGATALTTQNDSYHGINWSLALRDEDITVVHLLAVHPSYQRRGIAKRIMNDVISFAKAEGKIAVRMDALASNLPAHHLYESLGFVRRDVRRWYAENTGWTDFYLFELVL